MSDYKEYDGLVVVTPKDFERLSMHHQRIVDLLPVRNLYIVGSPEIADLIKKENLNALFINENDIVSFDDVYNCIQDMMAPILSGRPLPRGICGWYYQQFLKMQFARICKDEFYMVWDGDTVPCKTFSMFDKNGLPILDLKNEYHKPYFDTLSILFPDLKKVQKKSFIAEHMLFNCKLMCEILDNIEANDSIPGTHFWEKIIHAVGIDNIQSNSFSEFETYGTYVATRHPDTFILRTWNSLRYGGNYFFPETICERDFTWLSRDFFAISFEKGHTVREDHVNLFDNPKYQEKLTARQMLELAQEDFEEGYIETWDD